MQYNSNNRRLNRIREIPDAAKRTKKVHDIKSTQDIKEDNDVKETRTWLHCASEQSALVQVKIAEIAEIFLISLNHIKVDIR